MYEVLLETKHIIGQTAHNISLHVHALRLRFQYKMIEE